jgi:hypothetical protein
MVVAGFNMKELSKGEYEPHMGCDGIHINPLELIGIIINIALAMPWVATSAAPEGGRVFEIGDGNTSTIYLMNNTVRDTNPIFRCLVVFSWQLSSHLASPAFTR